MGVKFVRDYGKINDELTRGLLKIDRIYEFFEMDEGQWLELTEEERADCAKTMADDIFYALADLGEVAIGGGKVTYDSSNDKIIILNNGESMCFINLM